MRRWWTVIGAALGVWMLAAALLASGAAAHAVLVEAQPADGASLAQPPAELRLRFNEPVAVVALRLIDDAGAAVTGLEIDSAGESILIRPATPLRAGAYLLSYRVVSTDGHPVGASLRFGIGTTAAPAGDAGAPDDGMVRPLAVVARLGFFATGLGAAGAALFVLATRPPPLLARHCVDLGRWLAAVGLVAALARLGLAGVELGGGTPAGLLQSWPWPLALDTNLGPATAVAVLALGLLLLLGPAADGWRALAALLLVASFPLTGHAASAPPRWLAGPALGLHVLAASFWAGSLLPLLLALRLERDRAVEVVQRFSRVAILAVAALTLAGGILTLIQLGGAWSALWLSDWGQRLVAKLALFGGLLALAAVNRLWLTPALVAGRRFGCRLRTTLVVDLALVVGVLGLTASLPLSPPPRAAPLPTSAVATLAGDGLRAALVLIPGRAGSNQLEVSLEDAGGAPRDAPALQLRLALPAAGIEPVTYALRRVAPGLFLVPGAFVPAPGNWSVRLYVLVDDFTKVIMEGEITVR